MLLTRRSDTIPKHKSGKARVATSAPMISLRTSYRFDNCQCAGRTKDSDEQQVALHRRKTTTKRSQRRERDQLSQGRVYPRQFHLASYFESARPAVRPATEAPNLTTPIALSGGTFSELPTLLSFSFLPSRLLAST